MTIRDASIMAKSTDLLSRIIFIIIFSLGLNFFACFRYLFFLYFMYKPIATTSVVNETALETMRISSWI